ncbi:metalloproteinase inhibitor 1-like [Rhinophrynus dorsalis]
MTDIQYLYTPNMESVCGFLPPSINKTKEFLITGHGDEEQILINSCGFIRPWDSLTASQKQGFQQVYEKNCACRIVPCYGTCETTSSNQCLWTDMLMNRKSQSEDMACVQFGDNMCRWDYLKSRLFTTISKLKSR